MLLHLHARVRVLFAGVVGVLLAGAHAKLMLVLLSGPAVLVCDALVCMRCVAGVCVLMAAARCVCMYV